MSNATTTNLVTLTTVPADIEMILLIEIVVELDQAVVAITNRRIGGEIIARLRRKVIDHARPQVCHQLLRD